MKPATGEEAKQLGMQLALEHAGEKWTADMLEKLRAFCKARKQMGRPFFKFEEFRAVALVSQWPSPPTHKAWGGLASAAANKNHKIISATGEYEKAESKKTHGHPVPIWRAL
jgi:hypothetical protein